MFILYTEYQGGDISPSVQTLLLKQRDFFLFAHSHVWLVFSVCLSLSPASDASPLAALVLHSVGLVVLAVVF